MDDEGEEPNASLPRLEHAWPRPPSGGVRRAGDQEHHVRQDAPWWDRHNHRRLSDHCGNGSPGRVGAY